jgi:hypothetical protein
MVNVSLRHRIPARRTERTAAGKTTDGQPQPTPGAVLEQGVAGVGRARGGEAARRRPAIGRPLVPLDHPHQPRRGRRRLGGHGHAGTPTAAVSRSVTSAPSSSNERSPAPGRAPTSRCPDGSNGCSPPVAARSSSRSRRRRRLRTTAGPTERPMAKATRGGTASGSRKYRHHSVDVWARRPWRVSRSNSRRSPMRPIKPRAAPAP